MIKGQSMIDYSLDNNNGMFFVSMILYNKFDKVETIIISDCIGQLCGI